MGTAVRSERGKGDGLRAKGNRSLAGERALGSERECKQCTVAKAYKEMLCASHRGK